MELNQIDDSQDSLTHEEEEEKIEEPLLKEDNETKEVLSNSKEEKTDNEAINGETVVDDTPNDDPPQEIGFWEKYKYILIGVALLALTYVVYIYLFTPEPMNFGSPPNQSRPIEPFYTQPIDIPTPPASVVASPAPVTSITKKATI